MVKAVVICPTLAAVFIILLLISSRATFGNRKHIGRRLGYKNHSLLFDPLVRKIDRLAHEKGLDQKEELQENWETSPLVNEHVLEDVNEYLDKEGKLNITMRLTHLFPSLDTYPKDGFVEINELRGWLLKQANERIDYQTKLIFESRDQDKDGSVSLREYLSHLSDEDFDKNGMEHGEVGWWREQFQNANIDSNGLLNFQEFRDLVYPEDSNNENIHTWLLREKIKKIDYNQDELLNFEEFRNGAFHTIKSNIEYEEAKIYPVYAHEMFWELDINKDNLLTLEEIRPMFSYLIPGEFTYAKHYASYLIHEVDEDGDEKLSLHEMINNEDLFYSTIYNDEYDDDYDYDVREEL